MEDIVLSYLLRKDFETQQCLLIELNSRAVRDTGHFADPDVAGRKIERLVEYQGKVENSGELLNCLGQRIARVGIARVGIVDRRVLTSRLLLLYTPFVARVDERYDFDSV